MHFTYEKSKILRMWLNILRNYVHSRTFFTQKIHPPPPPPPPPPAPHPTLPATPPARHPTLPAIPPCPPPHLASHPIWLATPPYRPAFPYSLAHLVSHDGVASFATH